MVYEDYLKRLFRVYFG